MPQMIENHIFPHATHSKHTLPLSSRQTSAAIPRLSGQTRAAAPARAQKAADEFARYLLTRNLADETLRAYTPEELASMDECLCRLMELMKKFNCETDEPAKNVSV